MIKHALQINQSPFWIALLLLVAGGISYLLYSKRDVPWSKEKNLLLGMTRFLGIFLLLLLLLDPAIRTIRNTELKPKIHLLLDNSQSVQKRGIKTEEILERVDQIEDELKSNGFVIERFSLNDSSDFSAVSSNLADFLKRNTTTDPGENQVASILISDGIYNQGTSPAYLNYLQPVFTLGVGDTIPPQDISITRALFNKISYKGNQTPIRVEITQSGYDNQKVKAQILENGKVISSKQVVLTSPVEEVDFLIETPKEGLRRLTASVIEMPGEASYTNNTFNLFMEIIDGKRKVLLIAASPHPDIKAIRSTLNASGNYDTKLYIPSIDNEKPTSTFDVVVYHGAFRSAQSFSPKGNPGVWYILSNETNIRALNNAVPFLQINRKGSQPDKVTGSFNQNFSKFKIEETDAFEEFPPIEVPFGDYEVAKPSEVVMYQKLGNFTTSKPLMLVFDDGSQKSAVLMGQNIWSWKLQEAAINGNSRQFDNLISKTIQYLSVSSEQERFRLVPEARRVTENEPVIFVSEVYNDIYERVYGNEIEIEIIDGSGDSRSFSFVDSEVRSSFRAPSLQPGIYRYKARLQMGGKTFSDQGQFMVADTNVESLNLTADHRLLRTVSAKSGGTYAPLQSQSRALSVIKEKDFRSRINSDETVEPLYRIWWWYLTIFLLFSTEWFLRKYWGAY